VSSVTRSDGDMVSLELPGPLDMTESLENWDDRNGSYSRLFVHTMHDTTVSTPASMWIEVIRG
jgi:hypothetical protein